MSWSGTALERLQTPNPLVVHEVAPGSRHVLHRDILHGSQKNAYMSKCTDT